jgi:hypothetical protein
MEHYNLVKKKFNDKLLFKLSQIGFALNCNLLFTNRISEIQDSGMYLIPFLENDQSIFISLWNNESKIDLEYLINVLKQNNLKLEFFLMDEPNVNSQIILLLLPYCTNIFCQNNNYDHPQVHCMPIGIRDCGKVINGHEGFSHDSLYDEKHNLVNKNVLCLLCFSIAPNDRQTDRFQCYNLLKNADFILNLNDADYDKINPVFCGNVPLDINYSVLHKSYYALCPKGAGEDTHRFWEAIYLNTIPIVKKSNTAFDKLYNVFPCLLVNDWTQINKEFLEYNLPDCTEKMRSFHTRYPNAYTDIESLKELLLQT